MIYILPQFWNGFDNGLSGNSLYETWIFQSFNIVYSALPIVLYAIFDKEFDAPDLEKNPKQYAPGLKDNYFNLKLFWYWIFSGVIQAFFMQFCA